MESWIISLFDSVVNRFSTIRTGTMHFRLQRRTKFSEKRLVLAWRITIIIYSVKITLYLYSAISFSSMRNYKYCIHIVYHPSFLPPPPLPSILSHSLPHLSSHPVSSLPLFLCPFFRSSIPGLIDSQLTFICHMRILKVAKLGKVPKYNLENTIYQIVKFTLFTRY